MKFAHFHNSCFLIVVIAVFAVSAAPGLSGCDRGRAVKPSGKPLLRWVSLLTYDMDAWNLQARNAAVKACSGGPLGGPQLFACIREKMPEDQRTRSWSIPLHEGPTKESKQVGAIRIVGKAFAGFTAEYVGPDGSAVLFMPDERLEYSDSMDLLHTVLEEKNGWLLLPKKPFPGPVWMEAGQQHRIKSVGKDVYELAGQSIVILQVVATGVLAREEIPADTLCSEGTEPTPEDKIRKFSIPWKALVDENGHLRLKQKYTLC